MPRMTQEEYASDLAAAKVEGFVEAFVLVDRLVTADLSLSIARAALAERRNEIDDAARILKVAADASRKADAAKPKRRTPPVQEPLPPEPPAE